ncbi:MAG: hypothetical protein N2Z81_04410 [Hydrogenothermaceae bacterium]|nr:hypothetical protein [Hydrogenothermaceae bacterium]
MRVNLTSYLRNIVGKNRIEIDIEGEELLGNILSMLSKDYPEILTLLFKDSNTMWDGIVIICNGNIEKDLSIKIDNDTEVTILLPAAGG